jgi:hypothetical protein
MNLFVQYEIRTGDTTCGIASFMFDTRYLEEGTIEEEMKGVEKEVERHFARNYSLSLLNRSDIHAALTKEKFT